VYVDIGACIGTHTLFFALMCPSTRVYAFEPRDHLLERLDTNVALNGQGTKVASFPYALSDRDEVVTANLDGTDWALACKRLDDVIAGRVDVIKIDVEGMEPKVIDGASAILAKWRPRVFAEAGQPEQFERLVEVMARHGYRPTGRVFNATPTYEFVPAAELWRRRLPASAGATMTRARRAMRRVFRRH
jgi:FkbM family methyltransferase